MFSRLALVRVGITISPLHLMLKMYESVCAVTQIRGIYKSVSQLNLSSNSLSSLLAVTSESNLASMERSFPPVYLVPKYTDHDTSFTKTFKKCNIGGMSILFSLCQKMLLQVEFPLALCIFRRKNWIFPCIKNICPIYRSGYISKIKNQAETKLDSV